jgi:putative ABC transport system ATP-binding protein
MLTLSDKENIMDAIQLENVSKVYHIGQVETQALNNINLSIAEGEFTALVGPSGSGKTTLLQLIGCLDKPDQGVVRIKGRDVTRLNANQRADLRRESIGFIFQFFALVPVLTAYENVELPLLLSNIKSSERRERVLDLLKAVGLSDRVNHRPDQMSGGEQQRVAIARALAPHPVMVLADEPTANLDTENGKQAMEIMQHLNEQTGTAFVFATHDPRVVAFARRVVKLRDGRIDGNGTGA